MDNITKAVKRASSSLMLLFTLASFFVMLALAIAGLYEFLCAIEVFFTEHDAGLSIVFTLKGLEFLFLSPLAFLTIRSVTNYIRSMTFSKPGPVLDSDYQERLVKMAHAKAELHDVKSLVVMLMAAIVATDLIGKLLQDDPPATIENIFAESLVFVVLVGYVGILHLIEKSHNFSKLSSPELTAGRD